MTGLPDKRSRQTDFSHYAGVRERALARFQKEERERLQLTEAQAEARRELAEKEIEEQAKADTRWRGTYGDPSAMTRKRSRTQHKKRKKL